jgi:hypothetical protein
MFVENVWGSKFYKNIDFLEEAVQTVFTDNTEL